MSPFVGDSDEMMNLYPSEEQAEALIRGDDPRDAGHAEVADIVDSLRLFGDRPIDDDVADRHIAMIALEAAVSPGLASEPTRPRTTPRARRRVVLSSLLTSMLFKIFAASVAVAAVGAGIGVAADAAAPGDSLYRIDRAMEQVGIANGGAMERVEEARSLVEVDLPEAVASAGEAAEAGGNPEAAAALAEAAERIWNGEEEQLEVTPEQRKQVAELLTLISEQLADGKVVGADVADAARSIRDTVVLPDQARQDVPPTNTPPVGDQPDDVRPVDGEPGDVPPAVTGDSGDSIPEEVPPVDVPSSRP